MPHTVPKRDPEDDPRGCGARRHSAGGSGGGAKLRGREPRRLGVFSPLRGTREGSGMPEQGWRWKCLCEVGWVRSRYPAPGRSAARREAAETPSEVRRGGVGSLPRIRQPGKRALPAPPCPACLSRGRNYRPGCSFEIVPFPLGTLLGSRGGMGRRPRRCWGRPAPPFPRPRRRLRARARLSENPCFPTWFFLRGGGTSSQRRALEQRPREQRGGPGPPPPPPAAAPCPPHAVGRRRSPAVPGSLWKRLTGCVLAGSCPPRPPRQLPRAPGRSPPALAEGRAAPAPPAGRTVRGGFGRTLTAPASSNCDSRGVTGKEATS